MSQDSDQEGMPSSAQWARLDERMKHLVSAVDEIKQKMATRDEIKNLVTQATHDSAVGRLQEQINTIREAVVNNSPASWMDRIKTLALTIAAVAAAGGVLTAAVHWADKVK